MANFFVNRPIVAMVISIIIVLVGIVSLQRLPVAQYPEIVPPMIQVSTTFVGASATDVEAAVATPLEQQVNGVENMIYMKSIQTQNVLTPAGQIGGPPALPGTDFTYIVRTRGRLMQAEEFAQIVLRTNPDGSQVRIGDVARVELGTLLYNARGRLDSKPA